MKLAELIDADRSVRVRGRLPGLFGDAYLLKHNSVYRSIRTAALNGGYSFVPAWPEYCAIGLSQLERIIKRREIPCTLHTRTISQLEQRSPGRFSLADLPGSIHSYHMHESAHCLADSLFKNVQSKTPRDRILKAMMCESFANACDAMAASQGELGPHRAFIQMHSYMHDTDKTFALKSRVIKSVGFRGTFYLTYFSYLYANFLYASYSQALAIRVLRNFGPPRKLTARESRDCLRLMQLGLGLSLDFRLKTNRFYFQCQGIHGNLLTLLKFDFYKLILKNKQLLEIVHKMADLVEGKIGEAR